MNRAFKKLTTTSSMEIAGTVKKRRVPVSQFPVLHNNNNLLTMA
jgi:hypothetical protein